MKNIVLALNLLVVTAFFSCKKDTPSPTAYIIVMPLPPAPEVKEKSGGTSISVRSKYLKVSAKNGNKKRSFM